MPIDASDLRDFAKKHCCPDSDEVTLRAAASRAYYGAYHALLPFAELLPVSQAGDASASHLGHRELLRRLREWKVEAVEPKLLEFGVTKGQLVLAMQALRSVRELADYRLHAGLSRNDVQQQVERCRLVLRQVQQIDACRQARSSDAA